MIKFKRFIYSLLLMIFSMLVLGPMLHSAFAHTAPSGWIYPPGCCNGTDCRPEAIITTATGFLIAALGITVPFGDYRIRPSGDSETHVCRDQFSVFCIYITTGT